MIAFHYQDAMAQAKDLKQASSDLNTILNNILRQEQSELSFAWKGENANMFLQKTEELYADIAKTVKLLSAVASAVEISAKAVKKAEDTAKEIASKVGL